MKTCLALIVAAGRGDRYGSPLPKQYLELGGKTILRRTMEAFLTHPKVSEVRVVIQPDHRAYYDAAVKGLVLPAPIDGAASRQASTAAGLETYAANPPDLVLIHDAVRPLVDAETISRVIEALGDCDAVVPGLATADTLRRAENGISQGTVDRTNLWRMQTPQGFRFKTILEAHRASAGKELTDDAAIIEAAGGTVLVVQGHMNNIKITTPDNMTGAEKIIMQELGDIRTGMGFDVHQFEPGTFITICGIEIPHDKRAVGHSDADVGLHALTDAIFGAIGEGDIGTHFPPSDPQWKGADSATFLRHAASLVEKRGGIIANCDVTLLCEEPKIGPHRHKMIARIAEILNIAPDRIAVKATTTEKMGFTGRSEGLAAQAIATVRLPG